MVDAALFSLNKNKIRCSYGALAQLIRVPAIGVANYLGNHRPEASWVVSLKTKLPTNYAEANFHPELLATNRMISTGEALAKLIAETNQT